MPARSLEDEIREWNLISGGVTRHLKALGLTNYLPFIIARDALNQDRRRDLSHHLVGDATTLYGAAINLAREYVSRESVHPATAGELLRILETAPAALHATAEPGLREDALNGLSSAIAREERGAAASARPPASRRRARALPALPQGGAQAPPSSSSEFTRSSPLPSSSQHASTSMAPPPPSSSQHASTSMAPPLPSSSQHASTWTPQSPPRVVRLGSPDAGPGASAPDPTIAAVRAMVQIDTSEASHLARNSQSARDFRLVQQRLHMFLLRSDGGSSDTYVGARLRDLGTELYKAAVQMAAELNARGVSSRVGAESLLQLIDAAPAGILPTDPLVADRQRDVIRRFRRARGVEQAASSSQVASTSTQSQPVASTSTLNVSTSTAPRSSSSQHVPHGSAVSPMPSAPGWPYNWTPIPYPVQPTPVPPTHLSSQAHGDSSMSSFWTQGVDPQSYGFDFAPDPYQQQAWPSPPVQHPPPPVLRPDQVASLSSLTGAVGPPTQQAPVPPQQPAAAPVQAFAPPHMPAYVLPQAPAAAQASTSTAAGGQAHGGPAATAYQPPNQIVNHAATADDVANLNFVPPVTPENFRRIARKKRKR